jgi:hypothetical protein
MDREGKGEKDSSKDRSDSGSEDVMDAAGRDSSRQQHDSEGATSGDQENR